MSTVVTQANEQLREAILAALGEAVAAGELPGEPIPAFVIEIPADRSHGDLAFRFCKQSVDMEIRWSIC